MTRVMAAEIWGVDLDASRNRFVFCGDSPNDEPMFGFFPLSVGVRNILPFIDRMHHVPAFVANQEGGEGFAEMVDTILSLKLSRRTESRSGSALP